MFKICLKYDKFTYKLLQCFPQVYNNLHDYENSNFLICKVMKSMFKTRFRKNLLSIDLIINYEDLILMSYTWESNTTIEVTMKKFQFKQHFATSFRHLTPKT